MLANQTLAGTFFRNTDKRGYRIKQAITATYARRLAACKAIKMTTSLIALKVVEKWSP